MAVAFIANMAPVYKAQLPNSKTCSWRLCSWKRKTSNYLPVSIYRFKSSSVCLSLMGWLTCSLWFLFWFIEVSDQTPDLKKFKSLPRKRYKNPSLQEIYELRWLFFLERTYWGCGRVGAVQSLTRWGPFPLKSPCVVGNTSLINVCGSRNITFGIRYSENTIIWLTPVIVSFCGRGTAISTTKNFSGLKKFFLSGRIQVNTTTADSNNDSCKIDNLILTDSKYNLWLSSCLFQAMCHDFLKPLKAWFTDRSLHLNKWISECRLL